MGVGGPTNTCGRGGHLYHTDLLIIKESKCGGYKDWGVARPSFGVGRLHFGVGRTVLIPCYESDTYEL